MFTDRDAIRVLLSDAHANGTAAHFSGTRLTGLDLTGLDFTGATFTGVDFTGANLTGANFTDATFTDCVLADATLSDTNFVGATVTAQTPQLEALITASSTGVLLYGYCNVTPAMGGKLTLTFHGGNLAELIPATAD